MSSVWRKIGSAFLDFEEGEGGKAPAGAEPVDTSDVDALLASTRALLSEAGGDSAPTPSAPAPVVATPSAPVDAAALSVEVDFGTIYSAASVPSSPKTAEEVLAVLQGLTALPPEAQKTAIVAMDQADQNWSLIDVVLDASNKVQALQGAKGKLGQDLQAAEMKAQADLASQDEFISAASSEIRAQIAELEKLLAEQTAEANNEKGRILGTLEAARTTHASNIKKIDGEIARLSTLTTKFGDVSAPGSN